MQLRKCNCHTLQRPCSSKSIAIAEKMLASILVALAVATCAVDSRFVDCQSECIIGLPSKFTQQLGGKKIFDSLFALLFVVSVSSLITKNNCCIMKQQLISYAKSYFLFCKYIRAFATIRMSPSAMFSRAPQSVAVVDKMIEIVVKIEILTTSSVRVN
jgi:hypothetical protein